MTGVCHSTVSELAHMRIPRHTCRPSVIDMPTTDTSASGPAGGGEDSKRADPRHTLGRRGEELAAAHLDRLGFTPLGRNERTRYGEIDLIAFDGRTLVFAEIKTRRVDARARPPRPDQLPLVWLRPRQRIRLRKLATAWLSDAKHIRPTAHTIRFDAIGVTIDSQNRLLRLDHIEGAW
jgi:putative endonuclease